MYVINSVGGIPSPPHRPITALGGLFQNSPGSRKVARLRGRGDLDSGLTS